MREKCPYSELFWSEFSRIWTKLRIQSEPGKIRTKITPKMGTFYAVVVLQITVAS